MQRNITANRQVVKNTFPFVIHRTMLSGFEQGAFNDPTMMGQVANGKNVSAARYLDKA